MRRNLFYSLVSFGIIIGCDEHKTSEKDFCVMVRWEYTDECIKIVPKAKNRTLDECMSFFYFAHPECKQHSQAKLD